MFPSMNDDVSITPVQLPDVSSTDKMIYLLLTPKLFGSTITAAIHSGILHHKVTPNTVCAFNSGIQKSCVVSFANKMVAG